MKLVILTAWILLTLAELALSREVRVSWDTPPTDQQVVGWRVWSGTTLIAASNTPTATINLGPSATTITVTAINSKGESPPSAPLPIPAELMWIQKSTDLQTWENVVQIPYVEPRQFIRLQIPPTP